MGVTVCSRGIWGDIVDIEQYNKKWCHVFYCRSASSVFSVQLLWLCSGSFKVFVWCPNSLSGLSFHVYLAVFQISFMVVCLLACKVRKCWLRSCMLAYSPCLDLNCIKDLEENLSMETCFPFLRSDDNNTDLLCSCTSLCCQLRHILI